jgi:outer membrane receptor for ferrienterochelin and colicin
MKSHIKKYITGLFLCCGFFALSAQNQLKGSVKELDAEGKEKPVLGVMLQWLGTSVGTYTNEKGEYSLFKVSNSHRLLVQYATYQNDTIIVEDSRTELNILLSGAHQLEGITVSATGGTYISVKPVLTTVITGEGLRKAACCNLSESFDNTVAVDVEYVDAVSGAKQISMLGLAGIYSQILLENVPYIRLLSNQFGLGFIPGTWMDAISISKGISSVTNGYEAISGQINVDFKKPETNNEQLFLNYYINSMSKNELNINSRFHVKENVSTMFLLHGEGMLARIDHNHDKFMDVPLNGQVNFMNRWDYSKSEKFEGRIMVSYLWEDRIGGQMAYHKLRETLPRDSVWGMQMKTHKFNVITKNGFLLKGENESIGTILSFTYHDNKSVFGLRDYNAEQISGYANFLYSNKYGKKQRSKLTVGASFQIDLLRESLEDYTFYPEIQVFPNNQMEMVPGVFAEYSYAIDEKFIIMPGFRLDYNFLYNKLFLTPRLHAKWVIAKNISFRLSAGKGYRTSHAIAENTSLLVSNRHFVVSKDLKPEEAYNAGISWVYTFRTPAGTNVLTVDYYYTHFINQNVIDLDRDYRYVYVNNLAGKSLSHSTQVELTVFPLKRFEIILAYRYNYVKVTTAEKYQQKAMISPHKAVLNLNYSTKFDKWKFNTTLQFNSSMRLPDLSQNHAAHNFGTKSPAYFILNAQITKKISRRWEVYVGGENLLNYKQKHPIISAENPFNENFDASVIYAPITGIMGYAGMRMTIK